MNFGQNLFNWFLSNAQSLVILCLMAIDCYRYLLWDSSVSFPNSSDSW